MKHLQTIDIRLTKLNYFILQRFTKSLFFIFYILEFVLEPPEMEGCTNNALDTLYVTP